MKIFAITALGLAALALTSGSFARAGGMSAAPGARIDGKGDWRRHEIVRTWRDDGGCQLKLVSYHRANGEVERRESRECGRD